MSFEIKQSFISFSDPGKFVVQSVPDKEGNSGECSTSVKFCEELCGVDTGFFLLLNIVIA
ncbi:hypothetical protein OkiPb00507_50030 [Escherichia coli]